MLPCVLQPGGQVVEGVPPCDVIDEEGACRTPVVGPRNGPEGFLAGCVPNLELDLFAIDINHARSELNTNCQVMHRLKPFVCEL